MIVHEDSWWLSSMRFPKSNSSSYFVFIIIEIFKSIARNIGVSIIQLEAWKVGCNFFYITKVWSIWLCLWHASMLAWLIQVESRNVNNKKFGIWFLVLCIWFQYIKWIEQKLPINPPPPSPSSCGVDLCHMTLVPFLNLTILGSPKLADSPIKTESITSELNAIVKPRLASDDLNPS